MTVNLRNVVNTNNNQKPSSLLSNTDYLSKNKITINNPKQTHFSVQGVQSYAPQQIKALKLRQDRTQDSKQGNFVPLKTVLLSNEIIDWPEDPSKNQSNKRPKSSKVGHKQQAKFHKMKEPTDQPLNKYLQKRKQQRINKKNAVSTNNQAIVKYEKNIAKKEALDYKLQKMKKQYKDYFKDTQIGEKKQEQAQEIEHIESEGSIDCENQKIHSFKKGVNKVSTQNNTTAYGEKNEKQNDSSDYQESIGQDSAANQDKRSNFSENINILGISNQPKKNKKNKNNQLALGLDLINNCSSYSEKLGSAIHEMFK